VENGARIGRKNGTPLLYVPYYERLLADDETRP